MRLKDDEIEEIGRLLRGEEIGDRRKDIGDWQIVKDERRLPDRQKDIQDRHAEREREIYEIGRHEKDIGGLAEKERYI